MNVSPSNPVYAKTSGAVMRRTFDGKTDDSKNDDSVTSKYYPSMKYAVVFQQYGKRYVECFRTRSEAETWLKENVKNG